MRDCAKTGRQLFKLQYIYSTDNHFPFLEKMLCKDDGVMEKVHDTKLKQNRYKTVYKLCL